MGIGSSIGLIVLGAILAFAISADQVDFINLNVVGWILMLAGLALLAFTLFFWGPRRRARATTVVEEHPGVVEEHHIYDDRI